MFTTNFKRAVEKYAGVSSCEVFWDEMKGWVFIHSNIKVCLKIVVKECGQFYSLRRGGLG